MKEALSYGVWPSPITAARVAAGSIRLSTVSVDGEDAYWLEGRPEQGGRNVLVRCASDGAIADVTPEGTNVRTRVHEYGGAPYLVHRGVVYYSEFADQRLYRLAPGDLPEALTPPAKHYYADASIDPRHPRLVCVREDHSAPGREAVTSLVSVSLSAPNEVSILVSGADFYSTPRFSPEGDRLCWVTWSHPRMPWDGTELWVADITADGRLGEPRLIAGGADESIFQPGWLADATLCFASDRTGWWNLYRLGTTGVEPLHVMAADFGRPQWQFGMATWAAAGLGRVVATYQERGRWRTALIDLRTAALTLLLPDFEPGDNVVSTCHHAYLVAGSPTVADAVVRVELATGTATPLRRASDETIDLAGLSRPEAIEFASGGATAYGFYYPPASALYAGPPGERPPLMVISHGGPTASTNTRLNLEVQYWTSRGFAVVDVNYRGSSGYGRAYRERLAGQWGIVDVADCVNAALHLVSEGKADPDRLVIRGRSAGGFTTLAALAFHPGVFRAGTSYFGVSDLEALAGDTHKFESRYLDGLIGPYPAARDAYRARSPIHHVAAVRCPVLFLHGAEDLVVPVSQAKEMAKVMRGNGLRADVVVFDGEQHGFRKTETIVRCLEEELDFYHGAFLASPPTGSL